MSKEIRCYIESHYKKVDHSRVNEKLRNTFATLGNLFEGKPICAFCVSRLALVADAYGYSQRGNIRGNITNVDAKVSLEELIEKSPLKPVFEDYDLAEIKSNLDRNLFELEPQKAIQPPIQSEIDRISGAKRMREV